ncbi:nickel-dependent hydrogenase large subunit [Azotobacter chroococcum]|uniref:nickel-dependent hydrogenase large subunit n=1 Tax=Azotobacter chroococcum TaxID=353 RepID=UPI0010AEA057|nr:nickel-dependent hydrogenase large subunit [Azotobacter chroococcum]TKD44983.1 hydrogenase [Azotobacter chroococcum]
MSGLDSLAGRLQVEVRLQDGVIRAVDTRLQRPLAQLSRLLVGQTAEAALARLPLLFSLCAAAQQVAALRALERAAGWPAEPEVERGRSQLTELELIRESLLRLVQVWELPLPLERLKVLLELCRRGAARLQPLTALRAAPLSADPQLEETLAELAAAWADLALPAPADWLSPRLSCWREVALGGPPPAVFDPAALSALLAQLRAGDARAEIAGAPRITGPAAAAEARVTAAAQIEQHVGALLRRTAQAIDSLQQPSPPPAVAGLEAGEGVGLAQTARGALLHRVCLGEGTVGAWQLLAPTDWNFHADGPLRRRLCGVRVVKEDSEALLRALILAVDPCVAFEVKIVHA